MKTPDVGMKNKMVGENRSCFANNVNLQASVESESTHEFVEVQ